MEKFFSFFDHLMQKLSSNLILLLALLFVILIGIPDYVIGVDISLSIFYVLPLSMATWYAGRNSGFLIALISALPSFLEQLNENYLVIRPGIFFWNLFLHISTMLLIAFLIDRQATHLKKEKYIARIDPVTEILNRHGFFEHLQFSLGFMARNDVTFALAYIDLDNFKAINDRSGHHEGDRVLRLVASTLEQSVRQNDVVARMGGDEFALLIHGANLKQASVFIEKIRSALRHTFEQEKVAVTCSIGCVTFPVMETDINSVINAADHLMYKVKCEGKDGVVIEEFSLELLSEELMPV